MKNIIILAIIILPLSVFGSSTDDCKMDYIRCVNKQDKRAEYTEIRDAAADVKPGDVVLVYPGDYKGFRITMSGKKTNPIRFQAVSSSVNIVSPEPYSNDFIYIENANYVYLEGFNVKKNGHKGYGIATHDAYPTSPMRGLVIRNNTVSNSKSTNIYLSQVADSLIENNTVFGSINSHGIYLSNAGSDGTVIRNNHCYNNGVNGIHFNGDFQRDLANPGDGIQSNLVVTGNTIHDNDANGINMDGVQDSTIANNLIYNNGRHAIRAYAIDAYDGPLNLIIVNNTLVNHKYWGIKLTQDKGGHVVFNNIIIKNLGSIVIDNTHSIINRNILENRFSVNGEKTKIDKVQWKVMGFDLHSLFLPDSVLLESFLNSDYSPNKTSGAVDFGLEELANQRAPTYDIRGTHRPVGEAIDAGAYENP